MALPTELGFGSYTPRQAKAYEDRLDELARKHGGRPGWLRKLVEKKVITEGEYDRLVAFIDWDNA